MTTETLDLQTCLDFDGKTFEPELDALRLNAQLNRVYQVMRDGQWRTLSDICEQTGDQAQSVSARLRDFRKARLGCMTVERQRIGRGLFQYRLLRGEGTFKSDSCRFCGHMECVCKLRADKRGEGK